MLQELGLRPQGRAVSKWPHGLAALAAIAAGVLSLALSDPAQAALGGTSVSVEADRAHLGATLTSSSAISYTVHSISLGNGGQVREFARSDGVVFAIAWRGPGRPDLRQLLGDYFGRFQADNVPPNGRRSHRPLSANHADFVAQSSGHLGVFWGAAYLPQKAPAGFSTSNLQ